MKEREGGGRKRCGLSLLFLVSAFILELLPYGTVLPFAVTLRRAFSYFGLTPFGYADFPPFLTALLTMLLPAPCLRLLIRRGKPPLCEKRCLSAARYPPRCWRRGLRCSLPEERRLP